MKAEFICGDCLDVFGFGDLGLRGSVFDCAMGDDCFGVVHRSRSAGRGLG